MTKITRPSANATRLKILQAAQAAFLKHGFDGAKTQAIAKAAGVHSNLVFHHFKNKSELWLRVKEFILEEYSCSPQYDLSCAENYFKSLLDYRFKLYQDNPDLARLVQWQSLTEQSEALIGDNYASPNNWLSDIKVLQQRGELVKSVDATLVMLFVIYSSQAPFMQTIVPLSEKEIVQYKEIVLNACLTQFGV